MTRYYTRYVLTRTPSPLKYNASKTSGINFPNGSWTKQCAGECLSSLRPETVVATIPKLHDLTSVVDVLEKLQKSLLQLVSEEGIEGEVKVERGETGSLLLFLYLKTMAAVDLVGRALRSAAVVYQEIQKGRILGQHVNLLKEHVRAAQIKNDLADVLAEAQEELIRGILDREARAVEDEIFGQHDNERLQRIKNSVRLFAELFDKGTTIHPALEMPEEHQAKFPDPKNLESTLSSIKQLESKPASTAAEDNAAAVRTF